MYIEMDEKSAHVSTELVVAEGEVVSVVDDVTTAVACYISSFFVFHLQYIPELVKTIAFYQYGVLKIDDQTGIHSSYSLDSVTIYLLPFFLDGFDVRNHLKRK